jgi:hypothetical protein
MIGKWFAIILLNKTDDVLFEKQIIHELSTLLLGHYHINGRLLKFAVSFYT